MSQFEGCIERIAKAMEGKLTKGEARAVIEEVERRALRGVGQNNELSLPQAIEEKAEALAKQLVHTKMIEKRNRLLDLKRRETRRASMQNLVDQGLSPNKVLQAFNVGVEGDVKAGALSVDARQRAQVSRYFGGFITSLEKEGLMRVFLSKELSRDISRELFDVNSAKPKGSVTGNKDVRRVAEIMSRMQKKMRDDLNAAGADINQLEHYMVRQTHDQKKIRKASQEDWKGFIKSRLDPEKTFGDSDPDEYLDSVYIDIYSNHILKHDVAQSDNVAAFKGFRNIAKNVSQSRKLHFKDADAWYEYNERFGTQTLHQSFMGSVEMAAKQKVLMESYGTNPKANYEADKAWLAKKYSKDPKALSKLGGHRALMNDAQFNVIDGSAFIPVSPTVARIGNSIRVLQSVSKLGGAAISSLTDITIKANALRNNGVGFLEGYGNGVKGLLTGKGPKERRELLTTLGAGVDSFLGNVASRHMGADDIGGRMSKLQSQFMRLNLLNYVTNGQQTAMLDMLATSLADKSKLPFAKLPKALQKTMSHYGISEAEWKVYKKAAMKMDDGREYLTPDAVDALDDAVIDAYGGGDLTKGQIKDLKTDLSSRLQSYYTDNVDVGVIKPSARIQAIQTLGFPPGSPQGEAMRFLMQFKSFPIALAIRPWGRALMSQGKADVPAIINLAVMTTALGYVSLTIKDLTKGIEPRDPNDPRTWRAAMIQGGAAHFLGDFLLNDWTSYGRSPIASFMGPTIATGDDFFKLFSAMANEQEKVDDFTFKILKENTPGINLFYTRTMLNYLFIYEVQEHLSPGYLSRIERSMKKNQGAEFFLKPSEATR